jgi:hypothetical protein
LTRQTRPLSAIKYMVLHHAGSADQWSTHESLDAHLKATNLGYHVSIDDDAVFKAKAAGHDGKFTFKQHAPLTEVVWGAAGCNYNGAHLSVDGNSSTTGVTEDEVFAVVQVLASWAKQLNWKKADVARIIGHNHVGKHISSPRYVTECPGRALTDLLPQIRERVAKYLPA